MPSSLPDVSWAGCGCAVTDGGGGPTPPVDTGIIYWGRSTSPRLTSESEIKALEDSRTDSDYLGDAPFEAASPPNYAFIAWPMSFGGPTAPNGFMVGAFPASMADTSVDDYGEVDVNGYAADTITVNGEEYLVYRLYYATGGAITLSVI
jgi:hypothetical protein